MNTSGCTFAELYHYRLSVGYWSLSDQLDYNISIQIYQSICTNITG